MGCANTKLGFGISYQPHQRDQVYSIIFIFTYSRITYFKRLKRLTLNEKVGLQRHGNLILQCWWRSRRWPDACKEKKVRLGKIP
ncbi:hypothetical protein ACHQM5_023464 [Ranunculus cassubicifolius]